MEPTLEWSTLTVLHSGSLGITCKHEPRLERFAVDKHSSLIQTLVNYARKKHCNVGPSAQTSEIVIRIQNYEKKISSLQTKMSNTLDCSPLARLSILTIDI
jgi:hypothetical protein